jgi:hypothetical protein
MYNSMVKRSTLSVKTTSQVSRIVSVDEPRVPKDGDGGTRPTRMLLVASCARIRRNNTSMVLLGDGYGKKSGKQ